MSIINQTVQTAMQMTMQKILRLSASLTAASGLSRSQSFRQWLDFNQSGHVEHLQVQSLEWLHGMVYRKHTRHILLFYNFDVNGTTLKSAHLDALDAFTLQVVKPHFLNVLRGSQGFGRFFEYYEQPFAVNVSGAQKLGIVQQQPWLGSIRREDALKFKETERYMIGHTLLAPFDRFDRFFPIMDPALGVEDLSALSPTESRRFVDGPITEMQYNQYMPFVIDKLLNIGPANNSSAYPFEAITGHASATGPDSLNDTLSQQRAEAVVTQLHTLLSDHCADFDNVNPALRENVQALGRSAPIWPQYDEVDENRSVKLVFETAYDYLHLQDETELYNAYDQHVGMIQTALGDYIAEGRAARQAVDNGGQVALNLDTKSLLDRAMANADQHLALGMSTLKFSLSYKGDFATLRNDADFSNIPPRANSSSSFEYKTPEYETTPRMLPIPFILQYGSYSENIRDKYNLPVSAKDKVVSAASELGDYNREYAAQLVVDALDVILPWRGFNTMGEVLQHDYENFYASHPIIAHSFLLTELGSRQAFEVAVDNQQKEMSVSYDGNNINVTILYYRFVTDELKENIGNGPYYWYDENVLNAQSSAKSRLASKVVEADHVYKDLILVRNEAAGMDMEKYNDFYYLLEIYFWIDDAK